MGNKSQLYCYLTKYNNKKNNYTNTENNNENNNIAHKGKDEEKDKIKFLNVKKINNDNNGKFIIDSPIKNEKNKNEKYKINI